MAQGSIRTAGGVSLNSRSDLTAASKDQWRTPWPKDELQRLSQCPVCGCPDRSLLHAGLVDKVFDCAPGVWRCWKCAGCGVGYLDPRPSPDFDPYRVFKILYAHRQTTARRLSRARLCAENSATSRQRLYQLAIWDQSLPRVPIRAGRHIGAQAVQTVAG